MRRARDGPGRSPPGRRGRIRAKEDGIEHHVNRAALAMVLSACCFLAAVLAVPLAFQRTEDVVLRIASVAPIPVGLWLAGVAWRMKAALRAARGSGRKGHG